MTTSSPWRSSPWRSSHHAARLAVLLLVVALGLVAVPQAGAATPPVVVTLTFDDGLAGTVRAEQAMHEAGLTGTFYITDEWVGAPGFVSRADLERFAEHGSEIGGHTATHRRMTEIPHDEQLREVCNNRATLQEWGFAPTSFSYPFAASDAGAEKAVTACGYHTARGMGSIKGLDPECATCDPAEDMVPDDPLWVRAPSQVHAGMTLEDLQSQVTQAEDTGGWVVLTFHDICTPGAPDCPASSSISPEVFESFVSWLADYADDTSRATEVRTMDAHRRAELGTDYEGYASARAQPLKAPAVAGANALVNTTFDGMDPFTGHPDCLEPAIWGGNDATYGTTDGFRGGTAGRVEMRDYRSGDAKWMPAMDLGRCTPTVEPGKRYRLSAMYRTDGDAQMSLYYRSTEGTWHYWTSSPHLSRSARWAGASYLTPPLPADANGLSFGMALTGNGVLDVDDLSMVEHTGGPFWRMW